MVVVLCFITARMLRNLVAVERKSFRIASKKQQMQWSKRGAHLLLQMRVKTLNRELGTMFKRWYSDMEVEEMPDAA